MRQDLNRLKYSADLDSFGQKVESLKSDGMSMADIARRFGIAYTTLCERMREYRARKSSD